MEPTVIFETVHGSQCYGLAREGSDVDRKGVVVGPLRWYFGVESGPEQIDLSPDHVRFDLRKMLRLLLRANPTLLELLFTDPADHEIVTPAGERLLAARDHFVTRQVADTFGGYARGQLERIRTHRRWLLHPPEAPPTRAEFGLPEKAAVPKDQLGAAETLAERGALDASAAFLELLAQEKRYRSARERWKQFQQWKKTRNPKRSALEARFGYDTKHAMHLLRLQRMAIEILRGDGVRVRRDDREELLAIRDGALTYDALVEASERNHAAILEARASCTLPERADPAFADELCVTLLRETHGCH